MRLNFPWPSLFAAALIGSAASAQTVSSSNPTQNRPNVGPGSSAGVITHTELAGQAIPRYPYFQYTRANHELAPMFAALDPTRFPDVVGKSCDLYVVQTKSDQQWIDDPSMLDARGASQPVTFSGSLIQQNIFQIDAGSLSGTSGTEFGIGYDVVLDFDFDGRLSLGDYIDGGSAEAGFYLVRETTTSGPLNVTEIQYSGGTMLGQNTYYPTNIAQLDVLPLVVISHGNGHDYRWYDHIGFHLASWGYIVMSHQNNTGPGIETASTTTLTNTEYLLANEATIGGGALLGHIDRDRIVWIGHSRGGEGVCRAYNRVMTGQFVPTQFTMSDIRLVCSIAPTGFLTASSVYTAAVPYQLFVGASDSDVSGSAANQIVQSYPLFERAVGPRHCMTLQGAGHADFHNQSGNCWCTGPALIGKAGTHPVQLTYYLALVKRYTENNVAALDFFTRMYDDFHAQGIPPGVIVATEYRAAASAPNFVLEDYQLNSSIGLSSSNTTVITNVLNLVEQRMIDLDNSFQFSAAVPMNGMTRNRDAFDNHLAAVFDWTTSSPAFYQIGVPPAEWDLTRYEELTFRACQGTRHPETDALDRPLAFGVTLIDGNNFESTIDFGTYGQITRTYERTGSGLGAGWANEYSTVRLRLSDFLNNGSGLNLKDVRAVRFDFGLAQNAPRGRIGLDDVQFVTKGF